MIEVKMIWSIEIFNVTIVKQVIIVPYELSLLFCNLINALAYHLAQCKLNLLQLKSSKVYLVVCGILLKCT